MPPPIDPMSKKSVDQTENDAIQEMAHDLIQQAIDLLHTLNDVQYTHSSKVMPGGTIGKHLR
jgi:hypothetical protein